MGTSGGDVVARPPHGDDTGTPLQGQTLSTVLAHFYLKIIFAKNLSSVLFKCTFFCFVTHLGKDGLHLLGADVAPRLSHDVADLPLLLDEGIGMFILSLSSYRFNINNQQLKNF